MMSGLFIILVRAIMKSAFNIIALLSSVAFAIPPPQPACRKDDCLTSKGPVKLYRDIHCKPVFRTFDDCCPMKYDCSHIEKRSFNKCYAFGKEYSRNEEVSFEDRRCGPPCKCRQGPKEVASFSCAPRTPIVRSRPGCYRPRNSTNCGFGSEVCFDKPENMPTCKVNGRDVKPGYFETEIEPKKLCWCNAGWNDDNKDEVFCEEMSEKNCGAELYDAFNVRWFCAPIFNPGQSPAKDCNHEWLCAEPDDRVIPREKISGVATMDAPFEDKCKFGSELTLRIADEIRRIVGDKCIRCSCVLPPFLTCLSLPQEDCSMNEEKWRYFN